jgi:hypothetical protein
MCRQACFAEGPAADKQIFCPPHAESSYRLGPRNGILNLPPLQFQAYHFRAFIATYGGMFIPPRKYQRAGIGWKILLHFSLLADVRCKKCLKFLYAERW